MMQIRVKKSLYDIEGAIANVEQFLKGIDSFEDYEENLMLRRAVEREIGIVGEAMNRILQVDPDIDIPNARRIVQTRNKVIHHYDYIDNFLVYTIATERLPELKADIAKL